MSIRFAIKNTAGSAEKEGDTILRFTGNSEPFFRVSEREAIPIGQEVNGDDKVIFTTGLNENKVDFLGWYDDEERVQIRKTIKELKPIIVKYYGGEQVVDENNRHFWLKNRDVARLSLTNQDMDVFYDTKNPTHALLYLSIVSGAFIDTVAPTKEWAEKHQLPHFIVLDTEDVYEDDDQITRSDAHGELAVLRKEASGEALFILSWCLLHDTTGFGAISRNTPQRDLINNLINFIDGKLVSKKKRNTAKMFVDYAERWTKQQTRPLLITEAYIKAGDYYSIIQHQGKKFTTAEGTELGNSIPEAIETIMKPKYSADYEAVRDKVEAKWKE